MTSKRILIVGGGFAGMYAAMEMKRLVGAGHAVTLVSAENFMQYQPFLPEVASGTIDPRAVVVPLRPVLKHATVEVGEVTAIDHEERRVQVRIPDGATVSLGYDVLVVTAGSWSRVLPIPGLAEHGIGFKTVQEAIYLRNHVLSRLDVASQTEDAERRRSALTFVFVGAGYAGVEALGELEDLARDAMRNYPTLNPRDMRWVLVEAAGRILPELPEDLAAYAQVQLERRRIEVLLDMRLDSTEGGTIRLSDGQAFEADTLVWTAGVKPSPLAGLGGLPVDERGRIVVDDHLRVVGVPDAWAAGDIAAVPDRTTGGLAPPTAQHAMREGRRLGKNVTATLLGGELAPFVWRNVGGVCSLGRYKGVANVFGIKVKGFLGWFLHRSYHLWAMPTIGRRVRIAIDWTIALLFPRDITQFGSFEDPRAPFRRAASGRPAPRRRYAPLRRCFCRSLAAWSALWLRAMSGISCPPASSSAAHRVRSRIEMMPATRPRSITGRWRMLRDAMTSAASAMSVFGVIVVRSRRVMPCMTFTLCGSPPAATRFTMSRSVTMPASFFPSSTTTEEMPFDRMIFATSANVSSAPAVFTSVCMISPTCIDPPCGMASGPGAYRGGRADAAFTRRPKA